MIKIGKNYDGNVMYLTNEQFLEMVNGTRPIKGTNQQKAKIRKLIN